MQSRRLASAAAHVAQGWRAPARRHPLRRPLRPVHERSRAAHRQRRAGRRGHVRVRGGERRGQGPDLLLHLCQRGGGCGREAARRPAGVQVLGGEAAGGGGRAGRGWLGGAAKGRRAAEGHGYWGGGACAARRQDCGRAQAESKRSLCVASRSSICNFCFPFRFQYFYMCVQQ